MSLIGGVIIFFGSMLFTSVVFPDYFTELRQLGEETMRARYSGAGMDGGWPS
jgi:hypothetical protein